METVLLYATLAVVLVVGGVLASFVGWWLAGVIHGKQ